MFRDLRPLYLAPTIILSKAFYGSKYLTNVVIEGNIEEIGENAFSEFTSYFSISKNQGLQAGAALESEL